MVGRFWQIAMICGLSLALVSAPLVARCAPRSSTIRHFRARRGTVLVAATDSAAARFAQEPVSHLARLGTEPRGMFARLARAPRWLRGLARLLVSAATVARQARGSRSTAPFDLQFSAAGNPLRC